MTEPAINSDSARLEMNARGHQYDAVLERVADMFFTDREAWNKLPNSAKSASSVYIDFRDAHRRAVEAGVITDDRGPSAA